MRLGFPVTDAQGLLGGYTPFLLPLQLRQLLAGVIQGEARPWSKVAGLACQLPVDGYSFLGGCQCLFLPP